MVIKVGKQELSPKVLAAYQAIAELLAEGADLNTLTVSEITARAGIGKGTVYDYFANKEEMLAGALYHEMNAACAGLHKRLREIDGLYGKMEQLLLEMEMHMKEVSCAFKMIHLLMDHSQVSKRLREILRKKKNSEIPIHELLRSLVEEEIGEGGAPEEDVVYLVMSTVSRLVCYAMYLNQDEAVRVSDSKAMRERLCRDICREVESCKLSAI